MNRSPNRRKIAVAVAAAVAVVVASAVVVAASAVVAAVLVEVVIALRGTPAGELNRNGF